MVRSTTNNNRVEREFDYSCDHFAGIIEKSTEKLGLERYSLYVMDYGTPVGFRVAVKHPERVQGLIVQNLHPLLVESRR